MRQSAISVLVFLTALSLFAEQSPTFRTSADVREGVRGNVVGTVTTVRETRNELVVAPDDDRYGTIEVTGDSVSTVYSGFGGVINGAPEVFTGSQGFANVRVGDRVDVRGVGRANAILNAEQVILLGRSVAADQVGVGQTRTPNSPSTPTASSATPSSATSDRIGRVDGIVRQVSAAEHRITIETDRHELVTIRGSASTPVYYHNDVYHIQDLDVGDHVRIEPQSASSSGNITARTIDVIQSVQEAGNTSTRSVGQLAGRVTHVDRANDMVQIAPEGGRDAEIRVDMIGAYDPSGRRIRASDVQVGDRVDLSGSYNGDLFVASTVRVTEAPAPPAETRSARVLPGELGLVTIYASVTDSLATSPQLIVRDNVASRTIRVYVADDLVVRTRSGGFSSADKLKNGDSIVLKAYRDGDGNYIAQTIRVR